LLHMILSYRNEALIIWFSFIESSPKLE